MEAIRAGEAPEGGAAAAAPSFNLERIV